MILDTNLKIKEWKKLLSLRENADAVQELLKSDFAKGFTYGPFPEAPFETFREVLLE